QVVFIGIHLPGYLIDHGFNATTGTIFLALVGLFNVVGTYTAGWLGGKYSKPHLLMGLYGLRGIAITAFLMLPLSTWTVYAFGDRKSTRLNSSHVKISYAVFCLKKKKVRASR